MAFKIYFKIYIKELESHSHLVYNLKLEEIKEVSMENIYFISDTHFGHWFAVWFWNRPFKNIREMNNVLIDNWNSRIKDEDVVVIVGDFFAGNKLFSKYLLKNLNGDKIFIKGNHDFKFSGQYFAALIVFVEVLVCYGFSLSCLASRAGKGR